MPHGARVGNVLAVLPNNSIRQEIGPIGRRGRYLPDRHGGGTQSGVRRREEAVRPRPNPPPHNVHVGARTAVNGMLQGCERGDPVHEGVLCLLCGNHMDAGLMEVSKSALTLGRTLCES